MIVELDARSDYPGPICKPTLQAFRIYEGVWPRGRLKSFFVGLSRRYPEEVRVAGPEVYHATFRVDPDGTDLWVMVTFWPKGYGNLFVHAFVPDKPLSDFSHELPRPPQERAPLRPKVKAAQDLLAKLATTGEELPLAEADGTRLLLRGTHDPEKEPAPWRAAPVFRDTATGEDLYGRLKEKPRPKRRSGRRWNS